MKRKILVLLCMFFGSLAISLIVPIWWVFAPVLFVCGCFLPREKSSSFIIGFISIFILWFICCFTMDQQNEMILSHRVIQLFHLPNSLILVVVTSIVGGIIGGLSSLNGFLFTKLMLNNS